MRARERGRYAPPVRFRYDTNTIRARKDGRPCDLICQVTRTIPRALRSSLCVVRAEGEGESERATPHRLGRPAAKFQVNILAGRRGVRDTRGGRIGGSRVPICARARGSRSRFVDSASLCAAPPEPEPEPEPSTSRRRRNRRGPRDDRYSTRYRVYKRSPLGESPFNPSNCLFVTRPRASPPSPTKTIHGALRANKVVRALSSAVNDVSGGR